LGNGIYAEKHKYLAAGKKEERVLTQKNRRE